MKIVDAVIQLSNVTKTYGTRARATTAIVDVNLEIERGTFLSVMGPSGSGKTTLLNVIAGLDTPDSGRVILNGTELRSLTDHALADLRLRTIGFVFQSFNLIPALTVAKNVSWPLDFSGYSRAEVRERTAEALHRVALVGREHRYPGELSGGEQQRVAIARAIATGPTILLADEPTGNLDSHTGRAILDLLRTVNLVEGMTVVMVTHNVFAAAYGDRTLELHDGRIIRDIRTPPGERDPVVLWQDE